MDTLTTNTLPYMQGVKRQTPYSVKKKPNDYRLYYRRSLCLPIKGWMSLILLLIAKMQLKIAIQNRE